MKRLLSIVTVVALVLGVIAPFSQTAHAGRTSSSGSMKYLVGLGDSRAAGGGLPAHEAGTGPGKYDTACKRSPYASIAYLASSTNTPVVNYSCVGATTDDIYSSSRAGGKRVPSQISQIEDFVLTDPDTTFVIQTGVNDVKWSTWLARCARSTTCGEKKRDTVAMRVLIKNYERRLNKAIKELRKAGATGHIVLVGAYNPVPSDPDVLARYKVTETELAWLESMRGELNSTTRRVANAQDNVSYTGVALDSPELQGLDDVMPLHPTIDGQREIAEQLEGALAT